MFKHSVKVPRNFKIAANIVKKVSTEGGSVKTLLYDDKLRHFRTNVLYALINETIKHAVEIDTIFESSGLLTNEPRLDPWLAKVLTAELLFGKKALPGNSKPEQTILSYKEQFEKHMPDNQDNSKTKAVRRPRYVRINTNLLTTSDAIRAFQDEGYRFIRCTSGSYDDFLTQIQQLEEYDFTQDYHVKTVFVFSARTKLHEHDLYLESKIVLQDKATAMAVHLLAPPPGSVALDMCAAPGMKTTQLAAFMRNQGKIYAVERNEKRYQTLCDFVQKTDSKCVVTLNMDCLEIKRGDYDDVEYIILDPSCSGSGMELCVHNYIDATRLAKLTSLQEKFLKHAMNAFPKAKRIVYSTCSIFPEENERVITNVVKGSRAKWKVQDVKELLKGQWNNFGSSMYGSMGTRCMYARPESDLTIGFFLAVLDRDPKDLEKSLNREETREDRKKVSESYADELDEDQENHAKTANIGDAYDSKDDRKKKKKNKNKLQDENCEDAIDPNSEAITGEDNIDSGEPKKKRKKHKADNGQDIAVEISENSIEVSFKKPKKKKHKEHADESNDVDNIELVHNDELPTDKPHKKKKKIKHNNNDLEGEAQPIVVIIDAVKKKKGNKNVDYADNDPNSEAITGEDNIDSGEPKKKRKKHKADNGQDIAVEISENSIKVSFKKPKKKKHKEHADESNDVDNIELVHNDELPTDKPHKKKKKIKHNNNDLEGEAQPIVVIIDAVKKKKGNKNVDYADNDIENANNDGNEILDIPKKKKKKCKSISDS